MAARKPVLSPAPLRPELDRLIALAKQTEITEAQLHEQRASFAFGNAPEGSKVTKESARNASMSIRLIHA